MSTTAAAAALAALGAATAGTGAQPVITAPVRPADTQPGTQARPDEAPASLIARPHVRLEAGTAVHAVTRPAAPATYSVKSGDTLSGISGTYCRNPADYPHLASASNIPDPNLIYPHQVVKLACDAALRAVYEHAPSAPVSSDNDDPASGDPPRSSAPVRHQAQAHVTGLSGTLDCAGLEALWEAAGGPVSAAPMAASVAWDESGGQQYAENPSGASGYFQILGQVVFTGRSIFDPMTNAENAVYKWRAEGDSFYPAWTTAGMAAANPHC